jgi:hypothetical protein
MPDTVFAIIRPAPNVAAAIARAARERHMLRTELIEKLLSVVVKDKLIDAVTDDGHTTDEKL